MQVIWICAGILVVCDAINLAQSMGGGKLLGAFLGLFVVQVLGTTINTGVMAGAGSVVEIEASSLGRLFSIALAQAVINTVGNLVIALAGEGNPGVAAIVGLVVLVLNVVLLSRSLGLGCGGLIAFALVELLIWIGLIFVLSLIVVALTRQ